MARKRRANGSRRSTRASQHIAVAKARRVRSLLRFLKAYGRGSEGKRAREVFAKRVGSSLAYVVHVAYGYRVASVKLAVKLERATHGLVSREELRPDVDWSSFAPRASIEALERVKRDAAAAT